MSDFKFSSLMPTRRVYGNGDEAEYLTTLYRLTEKELSKAASRVCIRRFAIFGLIEGPIAYDVLTANHLHKLFSSMGISGIEEPLLLLGSVIPVFYAGRAVCTRTSHFLDSLSKVLGRSRQKQVPRDLSVVLDAIQRKTGKLPPEYYEEDDYWKKPPRHIPRTIPPKNEKVLAAE